MIPPAGGRLRNAAVGSRRRFPRSDSGAAKLTTPRIGAIVGIGRGVGLSN